MANFLKSGSLRLADKASEWERRKASPSVSSGTRAHPACRLAGELSDEVSNLLSILPVANISVLCEIDEDKLQTDMSPT